MESISQAADQEIPKSFAEQALEKIQAGNVYITADQERAALADAFVGEQLYLEYLAQRAASQVLKYELVTAS